MSHAERLTKEEGVYEKDTVHQAFKYAANMMAISVLQKEYMKVGTDKLVNPEKFNPMLKMIENNFDIKDLKGSEARFKAALEKDTRWNEAEKRMVENGYRAAANTFEELMLVVKKQKTI